MGFFSDRNEVSVTNFSSIRYSIVFRMKNGKERHGKEQQIFAIYSRAMKAVRKKNKLKPRDDGKYVVVIL